MASINKVILIGHLGRDPELKYTKDNNPICNISLATARRWKDSQGNIQEETEWHRVAFFGKTAEVANKYLRKGNPVYVEGRLRTRKYTDKEGIERYQTEVICETLQLLGGKDAQQSAPASNVRQSAPMQRAHTDDEIPF